MGIQWVGTVEMAAELTPLQKAQVVEAGRRFDGEDLSFEERLHPSSGEGCLANLCDLFTFVSADGGVYEGVIMEGGAGTVFRAGTLEVVAERMEFDVFSADPGLRSELQKVLLAADAPD